MRNLVVLKVDVHDDRGKQKALETVVALQGIDSIGVDMKEKKLTIIGTVDPVSVVGKLRKLYPTEIISIGQAKEPVKKEEPEIEELEFLNQDKQSLTSKGMGRMAQEIRSTNGRCSELPENPNYPFLVKLFLQDNTNLTDIPPSFFEHLSNLEVLDMSNTSITTLPWSVSKLLKLQELLLKRCVMLIELPREIGSLTNLRVLDLEETELICLPEQIGCLLQLECLKFSLYKYADHHKKGTIISRETLSKLCSLKELSIEVDPECEWWDAEVEAIIDDLGKLGNLGKLKLYLPTHQLFQKFLKIKRLERDVMPLLFSSLSNFRLIVGRHEDPILSRVPRVLQEEFMKLDKCLKYVNLGDYSDMNLLQHVLQHIRALFILRPLSNILALSELDFTETDNITFCLLAECDSMETIIYEYQLEYRIAKYILRSLYYLGIHYMKNLRSICNGHALKGCFSNLKILSIHTCPKLTTIFSFGFLEDVILLEELVINDCSMLESLVDPVYYPVRDSTIPLPRLRKISLLHLPELEKVSCGQYIASNLETMVIYNCPKLDDLHPLGKCSNNVKIIKGESKWWESKKSGWSKEHYDYLVRVFVPLKLDDDEDDSCGDELAEAVHISLTSQNQATESVEDLTVDIDMKMKGKLVEQPKEELPFQVGVAEQGEHLKTKKHLLPPPYFICPISQEIMLNPVVAADGFSYEAGAIKGWMESGNDTSPMTNLKLANMYIVPNLALDSAIKEWLSS